MHLTDDTIYKRLGVLIPLRTVSICHSKYYTIQHSYMTHIIFRQIKFRLQGLYNISLIQYE